MQQSYTILCVDDDPRILRLIERYLGNEGYRVYSASSGHEMWEKLAELPVNLVLLDVRLPDDDGFSLVKKLCTLPNLAIIMLTGKADVLDKVVGLELGADDYVTKPFNERELLARVRTVLRRSFQEQPVPGDSPSRTLARFAGWQLDQPAQELTSPEGRRVVLTTREFQLLAALVEHAPRVLSRDSILEMLVGRDWTPVDRSVDVLIGKLRKKLGDDPQQPRLIKTMRGIGYKLGVPVEYS